MNEWEVLASISNFNTTDDDPNEYEISVIRKDNKQGHESMGWGGRNKIILFDGYFGNTYGLNILNKSDKKFMLDVANKLCEVMNKR